MTTNEDEKRECHNTHPAFEISDSLLNAAHSIWEWTERQGLKDWKIADIASRDYTERLERELAEAKKERDAYKKAEQENDERFLTERDTLKQQLTEARNDSERLEAATNIIRQIAKLDYTRAAITGDCYVAVMIAKGFLAGGSDDNAKGNK